MVDGLLLIVIHHLTVLVSGTPLEQTLPITTHTSTITMGIITITNTPTITTTGTPTTTLLTTPTTPPIRTHILTPTAHIPIRTPRATTPHIHHTTTTPTRTDVTTLTVIRSANNIKEVRNYEKREGVHLRAFRILSERYKE
jgi:hypothetical protein